MSKRPRLELDDDFPDTNDDANTISFNDTVVNSGVLLNLLRMVIARHSRNQKIRKEHFTPILHRFSIKGNIVQWVNLLKKEVENLFGLTLQLIGNEIVVTNCLQQSSLNVLALLLEESTMCSIQSGNDMSDLSYLMPRHKRKDVLINTLESILGGIVILIVSIVVVYENRIREVDLLDALKEFGFSENLNTLVANLNKNTYEILSELVRRDYISRVVSQTGDLGNQIDYSLGKRALRELEPETILDFMKQMFEGEEMHQKCIKTVQRCFPDMTLPTVPTDNEE